ncbi:hypothetical protein [Paraburkholderia kirstenboschensis]|uniref:Uncharacterized protein n=1 Tax=Paraburkholderia kirstenboschensis TaxID=1245436 RepID=A0ABZ0EKZ9_9BURK|nr:hypothetical protein [Paraburkholderia kirstenboschensis]WOD16957.1 hypothetical protein RW095_13925 [Paraburkholderia kirstenboschensis]
MGAVEYMVLNPNTEGFARMQEAGLFDRTLEFVVLRHPSQFKPEVVAAAKKKLEPWLGPDNEYFADAA